MYTLSGCVNGAGQQVPPFFIFPGARIIDSLLEGAIPGADGHWNSLRLRMAKHRNIFSVYAASSNKILTSQDFRFTWALT